jgi:hypothetical protein
MEIVIMEQENLENEQETILDETPQEVGFEDLGLAPEVLEAVKAAGYETPSPIQAKAIPALLQGKNLLGTAQTGTGKTAAFALPLLSRIEFNGKDTSLLVLTPTRELSIQVAEAIQQYAMKLPKVHVVPVYGGQDIAVQFKALKRAANVIVATPGRLIDHLKRGSIVLDKVQAVVLDEADEMLDMGFMEDVETILSKIPKNAQRALFSATMPKEVIEIIDEHLESLCAKHLGSEDVRGVRGLADHILHILQGTCIQIEVGTVEQVAGLVDVKFSQVVVLVGCRHLIPVLSKEACIVEHLVANHVGNGILDGRKHQVCRHVAVRRVVRVLVDVQVTTGKHQQARSSKNIYLFHTVISFLL